MNGILEPNPKGQEVNLLIKWSRHAAATRMPTTGAGFPYQQRSTFYGALSSIHVEDVKREECTGTKTNFGSFSMSSEDAESQSKPIIEPQCSSSCRQSFASHLHLRKLPSPLDHRPK